SRKVIYHVNIRLEVPGRNIVVDRESEVDYAHSDIKVAIRDSFRKITRQLEEYVKFQSGRPHPRVGPVHAKLKSFDPFHGFGFVETADGREFYFHKNCLVNTSGDRVLVPGHEFRINTEMGQKGPQV